MRLRSVLVAAVATAWMVIAAQPFASGAQADVPSTVRIGVLIGQDSAPGQQTLEGIRRTLEGHVQTIETFELEGDATRASTPLERARQGELDLLVTVGSVATGAAVRSSLETPVVACLVLRSADLGEGRNVTGNVLEFPVETELSWLKQFLPRAKHVGVLFSPQNNQNRIDTAARAAKAMGFTLHAQPVGSPREIPAALDSLAKEVDVLWGLADPVVLTPETAQPILLFSFRNRIPFIGLSQSWAKAGALYALDRDYIDIGAQCGELALQALGRGSASSLPPTYPRKVVYWINLKTARHMKITLDPGLVKGAQDAFD